MSRSKPAINSTPTAAAEASMTPPSIQVRCPSGAPAQSRLEFDPITGQSIVHLVHPTCDPNTHRMIPNGVWKDIIPILNGQPFEKVNEIFEALSGAGQ